MSHKYILFRIHSKYLALKIVLVREVLLFKEIDELPRSSKNIKGIFNLRGQVIPVIDLPKILGLQQPEVDKPNTIVLEANGKKNDFGFQVDEVLEVIRIEDQLLDANVDTEGNLGKYITGVVSEHPNHKDKLIYILDECLAREKKSEKQEAA